ncbi:MAG: adenine nucleotide alpha hydrolase [Nitrososphaerota archaeon]|nr:adenine nucleotide alpha hydrolase [Nitrososphaerota archaeon]MDG6975346.1 adenine nucleotide alpha hydrolase [Nitrososphaerota archaeon]MDG6980522.1 adenine nucleotide alpha hydrolase [Nitrososphaerota archaeon]MDG7027024.1 adenine nucleotide alpha hydrolase [Nitrososphaerota archaeon]MDG7030350.1 adenine nucleotide alpha hydrolase [Nitrososphaerota archaeon]
MPPTAVLSWSGGKDSALALYDVSKSKDFEITSLMTTLTRDFGRISMHGVRRALLTAQADRLRLPVDEVWITKSASNAEYERYMSNALEARRSQGVRHVVFGDLFLKDIRDYREKLLSKLDMVGVFPLWMKDTRKLAHTFLHLQFKAIVCTVDPEVLDGGLCGRDFDESFLSELPAGVDPCGENGEFHTFVYGGPIFDGEIGVKRGEVVLRDGFCFTDILPD